LKKANNLIFLDKESKRKRLKLSDNDNDELQAYCNFEVQVSLSDPEYENKINELMHLNKQLLSKINELKHFNKQLLSKNKILKKKLDSRFANQEDRIKAIINIAKKERKNLYDDILSLIIDHEKFQLNSLLKYSPSQWLIKRNLVVVKFIEILTYNENENQHEGEKLFKYAVAIDMIYEIRHLKYVSAINLVTLTIKYSIARSKSIIDIDNHFINARGYTKFIKW